MDGGEDYRLRTLRPAEIFFVPNNEENEQKLAALFKEMSGISELNPGISIIHGREIPHKPSQNVLFGLISAHYVSARAHKLTIYI